MDAVYSSIMEWLKLEWRLSLKDSVILLGIFFALLDVYRFLKSTLPEPAATTLSARIKILATILSNLFWISIALNAYLSGHYHLLTHAVIAWVFAKKSKWVAAYDRWVDRRLDRQT